MRDTDLQGSGHASLEVVSSLGLQGKPRDLQLLYIVQDIC